MMLFNTDSRYLAEYVSTTSKIAIQRDFLHLHALVDDVNKQTRKMK